MAWDERLAAELRADLAGRPGLAERRMFGGLCFLLDGNMVCGTYRDRAMFRVGKDAAPAALALPGVARMTMGGRPMGGFVEADAAALARPGLRSKLLAMALEFVATLPPK